MKTSLLTLLSLVSSVTIVVAPGRAAAEPRATAATWIESLTHGKPLPKVSRKIKVVFDRTSMAATTGSCGKLRTMTIATDAELSAFASCVRGAMTELALDSLPPSAAADLESGGLKYVKGWFARSFHRHLLLPARHRLLGTSLNRPTPGSGGELGSAVMVYVVVNAKDEITAIYAYAGHWAYPV